MIRITQILKWLLLLSCFSLLVCILVIFLRPMLWKPDAVIEIISVEVKPLPEPNHEQLSVDWTIRNASKRNSFCVLGYGSENLVGNLEIFPPRQQKAHGWMCGTGLGQINLKTAEGGKGYGRIVFSEETGNVQATISATVNRNGGNWEYTWIDKLSEICRSPKLFDFLTDHFFRSEVVRSEPFEVNETHVSSSR